MSGPPSGRIEPIDWARAERVARRLAARQSLPPPDPSLDDDFAELTAQAEALVEAETGLRSAAGPARARVVDRPGWVGANIASFQRLLRPLTDRLGDQLGAVATSAAPVGVMQTITGAEVGLLLGAMAGRVLGQYDLLVVEDEADDQDVVYYVGPNVASLERRFGFPPREFRLWLALHEVTHRAQFTGVPWMRPTFLGYVHELLGSVDADPKAFAGRLKDVAGSLRRGEAKARLDEGGLFGLVATPEQKETLARIGGLMSLLEGHGDVTMNRAGAGHLPSAARFSRILTQRRTSASGPAKLLQKLVGLEAKLAQYEQGEKFIEAIEAAAGPRVVDQVWLGPERLPTMAEIREPRRWLDRLGLVAV